MLTNWDQHAYNFRTLHMLLQASGEDERIRAQATAWSRMAQLAEEMSGRLKAARDKLFPTGWDQDKSAAGKVFYENVTKVIDNLDETAKISSSNHTGVTGIADAIGNAQTAMMPIYTEYYGIMSTIGAGGTANDYYAAQGTPKPRAQDPPTPPGQQGPDGQWWEKDLFNKAKPIMQTLANTTYQNWYSYIWHMPKYDGPMMANPMSVVSPGAPIGGPAAIGGPGAPNVTPPPPPPTVDKPTVTPPVNPPQTRPTPPPPDTPPGPILQQPAPVAPPVTPPVTPPPPPPGGGGPGALPPGLVPPVVPPGRGIVSPIRPPNGGRLPFVPPTTPGRGITRPPGGIKPPATGVPPVLGGRTPPKGPGAKAPGTPGRGGTPIPPAGPGRAPGRTPAKPGAPGRPGATPPVLGGNKPTTPARPGRPTTPATGRPGAVPPIGAQRPGSPRPGAVPPVLGNRPAKPANTTPGSKEKILGRGRPGAPGTPGAGRGGTPPVLGGQPPRKHDKRRSEKDEEFYTDLIEDDVWSVDTPGPAVIEPPPAEPYHGLPTGPTITPKKQR